MALTGDAYLAQLQALLPSGLAWPRDAGVMTNLLTGLAQEPARIAGRVDDLLRELNPLTSVELLTDWEAEYQIMPSDGASIEERQHVVWFRHTASGDIKKPYLVALAASLGYTIYIQDYTTCMADWLCADDELILEEQWTDFSAGVGQAGDTLSQEDPVLNWIWEVVVVSSPGTPPTPGLEAVLNDLKPAHIQLNFTYL